MTLSDEEKLKTLDTIASNLGEHFDHVQILVSWQEEGMTKNLQRGSGNWFARQGLAHEFINQDIAQENARQIAEQLKDNEV